MIVFSGVSFASRSRYFAVRYGVNMSNVCIIHPAFIFSLPLLSSNTHLKLILKTLTLLNVNVIFRQSQDKYLFLFFKKKT